MAIFFSTLDALAEKLLKTIAARLYVFNGSTWDRLRSGSDIIPTASGVRVIIARHDGICYTASSCAGDNDSLGRGFPCGVWGYNGNNLWSRLRTPNMFRPLNAVAIGAEAPIWTPAAGKKFRVMGYALVSSVAGNVVLRDNTAGAIIAVIPSAAGGNAESVDLGNGILSVAADNVLTAAGPASSTLSGMVWGVEE